MKKSISIQSTRDYTIDNLESLRLFRESLIAGEQTTGKLVSVCCGSSCISAGSEHVREAFVREIKDQELEDDITVKKTGCDGFCEKGPIVVIGPENIFYENVEVEDVPEIISETLLEDRVVERLLYEDPATGEKYVNRDDIPFYKKQKRIVLKNCGLIDPNSIEDYIKVDGFQALAKVLSQMTPEGVIEEIKLSGLRGRGGAGFPTGIKWETAHNVPAEERYIICNGDEGDPGAFMDRGIMEGDPYSVLEGMMIAGYAVGASQGIIYVRAEYPLAVHHLSSAIAQATDLGLLGRNIMGSGFDFEIKIVKGAGAFVCGEETALIASIEGKSGRPRPKPPFPAIQGLWGKPTIINNVETLANVSRIILNGGEWYSKIGTATDTGTKIFSLVGKVRNVGLVEVEMGTTLREIIFDIGGGIQGGKRFKAVQTGGPSGGCIPEELLDLPVGYESLAKAGSIMGSGGMLVMDESTCIVNIARYFLDFAQNESCGQCTPCRLGTKQMFKILRDITRGKGEPGDIEILLELSDAVKQASICGLGMTVPNPVVSTIRYFRKEYEEHIHEGRCRALVCRSLIIYRIKDYRCKACLKCLEACPVGAIIGAKWQVHEIDQSKCIKCGACMEVCPKRFNAVECITGLMEVSGDKSE
ncbi:MAG: NADH-quinone oxidoreductase subunit NuoF [Deltaproteobacteria bacterium]|nr:NADH-quinone oxidoreductase subunit NuoF [Deltaproteobacteria bacterium]